MARIVTGPFTTFNLATHLDPMTADLYGIADYFTSPGYAGATTKFTIDSGGRMGFGMTPVALLDVNGNARFSGNNPLVNTLSALSVGVTGGFPQIAWSSSTGATDSKAWDCYADTTSMQWRIINDANNSSTNWLTVTRSAMTVSNLKVGSILQPGADNSYTLGAASFRWSTVYAGTGTINTSDAREKTLVAPLADRELEAAKQLAREIGTFQFLDAVTAKNTAARIHVGLTVQRVMEIMTAAGLNPLRYAFICHDSWPESKIDHPAMTGVHDSLLDADGKPMVVETRAAWAEVIPAGDRYGFRADELMLFIARGFEARLAALEAK